MKKNTIFLIIFLFFSLPILSCKKDLNKETETDVSFISKNLELPGTLSLPKGDKSVPAVILVHGSGLNDRDSTYKESGFEIKPFKEIASSLVKAGFAVLRYDKRSYVMYNKPQFRSELLKIMPEDFISDAKAGIEFLKNHSRIDKTNIFFIAHSQAGSFAPFIAKNTILKGAVLLAPGLLKARDQITYQIDYQIDFFTKNNIAGIHHENIKTLKNLKEKFNSALKLYDEGKIPENGFIIGMTKPFFEAYNELTVKVSENISKMQIPVLLINGDIDLKCPKELVEKFKSVLTKKSDLQIEYIGNMTHILNYAGTMIFHDELNKKIISWLKIRISKSTS